MAGRPTLWGAGEILRTTFSKTAEAPPIFYLALVKEIPPNPYVSGSELDEPTLEVGYQRVEMPNDTEVWGSPDSAQIHLVSNSVDVAFVTATSDWGRLRYWALCNAKSGGYVYFYGPLTEQLFINNGDQAVLGTGELVIELGPFYLDEEEI